MVKIIRFDFKYNKGFVKKISTKTEAVSEDILVELKTFSFKNKKIKFKLTEFIFKVIVVNTCTYVFVGIETDSDSFYVRAWNNNNIKQVIHTGIAPIRVINEKEKIEELFETNNSKKITENYFKKIEKVYKNYADFI